MDVYFPQGKWYDWYTHQVISANGRETKTIDTPIDTILVCLIIKTPPSCEVNGLVTIKCVLDYASSVVLFYVSQSNHSLYEFCVIFHSNMHAPYGGSSRMLLLTLHNQLIAQCRQTLPYTSMNETSYLVLYYI